MTTNVQVFDELAGVYDTVLPFFVELGRQIVGVVRPVPGTRLLDLGAGRGAVTGPAPTRGARVTAVDGAPSMVARPATDHPGAHALLMDAHHLALPNSSFDVVVAAIVLTLVEDPAVVADEVRRVLAPGGLAAVAIPGGHEHTVLAEPDPVPALYGEFARYLPPDGGTGTPLNVADLLSGAGFVDVTSTDIEVCLEVPDGRTYWDWPLTHGSPAFADNLPADRRVQFHDRLPAVLSSQRIITVQRTAIVWTARRPHS